MNWSDNSTPLVYEVASRFELWLWAGAWVFFARWLFIVGMTYPVFIDLMLYSAGLVAWFLMGRYLWTEFLVRRETRELFEDSHGQ